jgi:membrane protein implicated in regulation of membrane protease activity
MHASRKRNTDVLDTVDVGIGIIGFFAFAFLVITVICELTGTDALGWALALLVFVLILTALLLARRNITGRRAEQPPGERDVAHATQRDTEQRSSGRR